jgi:hypothetical protein
MNTITNNFFVKNNLQDKMSHETSKTFQEPINMKILIAK